MLSLVSQEVNYCHLHLQIPPYQCISEAYQVAHLEISKAGFETQDLSLGC